MANNIKGGAPNAVVATDTVDFITAGITITNTAIIYLVDNPLKSYIPGRSINGITGFETGKGYYMVAKLDVDLSAHLIPPIPSGGGGGGSTDIADAFITAVNGAGTALASGHQTALRAFDTAMQTAGLWAKVYTLYPFAGSVAAQHKFNMVSPLDTDAAFRLSFTGGTSAADGYTTNGSSDFADTHFVPSAHSTTNNVGMSVMLKDATLAAVGSVGSYRTIAQNQIYLGSSGHTGAGLGSAEAEFVDFLNPASFHKVITAVRRGATDLEAYVDGVSQGNNTNTVTPALSALSSYIGARQGATGAEVFLAATTQFFAEHTAFTDSEAAAFNTAVKNLVSGLGR
jgi:hypothetical protein